MTDAKTLPCATPIMNCLKEIETKIEAHLKSEVGAAEFNGPISFARAFVVLRILKDKIEETFKPFDELYRQIKEERLPASFDAMGVPTINLDEGYRVTVAHATRASIKGGQRDAAFEWLRDNGLEDIVTATVNASTLSAVAKTMAEENKELPEELFQTYVQPTTSVTKVKGK